MNLKLACAALLVSATQASNLVELASGVPDLSTLVAAVQAAGLVGALSDPNTNLTVIAPVNSAFEGLPVDRLIKPEWKPQLTDLLLHHVVGSFIDETTLQAGDEFTTLNKENITVSTIDPLVISGATVSFSASVDNGIAYVVDKVLLPTSATNDIVGIAAGNPAFSTLVDLVTKAGLAGALTAEGPLTVFAPTNDAFDNLPNGTLTELAKPENLDKLKDILTYHVASGNAVSSGLTEGQEISMLNGKSLKFMNGMIGSAGLVATDVLASNGVIHVIDNVLIPPTEAVPSTTSTTTGGATTGGVGASPTTGPTTGPTSGASAFAFTLSAVSALACAFLAM